MDTMTPRSSALEASLRQRSTSLALQTPTFNKESQPSHLDRDDLPSHKKRVLFTPKLCGATKDNKENINPLDKLDSVENQEDSPRNIRTISKTNVDANQGKGTTTKKPQNFSAIVSNTPVTMNKKKTGEKSGVKSQKTQKYGKRKCEFSEDGIDTVKEIDEVSRSSEERRKIKQAKIMVTAEPKVTKIYLYNSKKTQMYCFPVYKESDLKYSPVVQSTLRNTDIDNDCETENEILEYSIYQSKKDLLKGIQMQRDEDRAAAKAGNKVRACSQEAVRDDENKISRSLRTVLSQDDKQD